MNKNMVILLIINLVFIANMSLIYGLKIPIEINKNNPFISFDLGLSEEDKKILEKLSIENHQKPYDNFGHLEDLELEIIHYLRSIGNNEKLSQAGAAVINSIVVRSLQKMAAQTAWITIRSFKPNEEYNIPRWHMDGYYYQPFEGPQYKIACALKGPGTLFCKVTDETKNKFTKIEREDRSIARAKLAELLADHVVEQAPTAQAMLFIVGDDSAAVHSEPKINEDRLFISIVPGTCEQIQELYDRWHPKK